jgi:hypothetical protein
MLMRRGMEVRLEVELLKYWTFRGERKTGSEYLSL